MKQFQIDYRDNADFRARLAEIRQINDNNPFSGMIFYFTWTEGAQKEVDAAAELVEEIFPDAGYYGNEASGNIAMGEFTFGLNVTCYAFEKKDTATELVWVEAGTGISSLEDLWRYCNSREGLRAVEMIPSMSYVETLQMDGNIPDLSDDILIFGGASVNYDNSSYDADIIAKGHPRTQEGMAVMLYFGSELEFSSNDILGWKGLGRLMEVTDSTGKVIKEIDNSPAYSIYENYLNLTMEDRDTLVFPLIVEEDGKEYIRTPQTILPDRSMQMFANIPKGAMVRISYGDKNTILGRIFEEAHEIAEFRPEAIKAYSCAARRLFWGDSEVGKETGILEEIAPVCGFYTGGEILRFGEKLRVLNQTLAIISFREGGGEIKAPGEITGRSEDKSLISRLTYFTEKIVEEERTQRALAQSFEAVLSSEFQVMYYINLEEGKASFIHGDEEARRFMRIFNSNSPEKMFANFHRYYVDMAIVEEDRERVKSVMNAENLFRAFKDSNSLSVNFRVRRNMSDPVYTEMRVFKAGETDGRLTSVVLTFKLTDEEVRNALSLTEQLQSAILNEMLGDDGVFLIDCENDRRRTIHDRTYGADRYDDDESYTAAIHRYINNCVARSDRDMMLEVTSTEYMLSRLKEEKEYSVTYRDNTTEMQRFYQMKIARFSDSEVLQSFSEKDKAIIDSLVLEKMENDYFAMFAVDLDAGMARVLKNSKWYRTFEVGMVTPFEPAVRTFASAFEGETAEFFRKTGDIEYLKTRFEKDDKATFVFRSQLIDETKWVNATELVLSRHDDGTPLLLAICFSILDDDAKEKEELKLRLQDALDAAEAASRSKTAFLFNMSHDIRTPMNAMMGFTNMAIKHADDSEKVLDCLSKAQQSGDILLSLINSVLEVSRIESGNAVLDEKPGNIFYSFVNIENTMYELAKTKDIHLSFSVEHIMDRYIYCDFTRCMRVFVNIITNAIKYTPRGGVVKVRCVQIQKAKDGYANYCYTFDDNGMGMSKEFQKHVFDQFSRENTSTVSGIEGTGLGLAVCKSFVDLMGGMIECYSEQGVGTRFTITLPFKVQDGREYIKPSDGTLISQKVMGTESHKLDFSGKKVLLVEDNELNREIAVDILEEADLAVEEAGDGTEAVEILREKGAGYYDFILMDIQMPVMNGYEATKAIREMYPDAHIPIIALSANAFAEDKAASMEAGMDDHVAKPINLNELFGAIGRFV